jgi:carboxypeptidase Taq
MWENLVGRSRAFWEYFYPHAKIAFGTTLEDVSIDDFNFAINDVRPSLIRVEADEATYNLHIIVRFELEQALLTGDLQVADLPTAWNEKYRTYLGIVPPSDASGVLQDIHWSAGLLGYFPTYSLGNLYASQLFDAADRELSGLESQFARGEFSGLLSWLRRNIHERGQCYTAAQLVEKVTGEPLSHAPLVKHLRAKYGDLYALK